MFKTVLWENTNGVLTLLVVITNGSCQCQKKHWWFILVAAPLEMFKTVLWENTNGVLTLLVVMNGSCQCQKKHWWFILVAAPLEMFKTVLWENTNGVLTLLVMANGSYQCQRNMLIPIHFPHWRVRLTLVTRFRRGTGVIIYRACSRSCIASSVSKDVTFWSCPFSSLCVATLPTAFLVL
jgi:hypothetical protein